ncbi:hypothetical protein CEXT_322431 [Caerostris extrusa]|uniref:Secreted protein n=1 Tax=Caerostris extrusa TaxID=172846 RepID=A0AAV4RSN1_CAEEX|nr:hypothetical protein CEXT_322431 [Caerostris extrusa]
MQSGGVFISLSGRTPARLLVGRAVLQMVLSARTKGNNRTIADDIHWGTCHRGNPNSLPPKRGDFEKGERCKRTACCCRLNKLDHGGL